MDPINAVIIVGIILAIIAIVTFSIIFVIAMRFILSVWKRMEENDNEFSKLMDRK